MFKPWCFFYLFFLCFALNAAFGHESVELSTLVPLQSFPSTGIISIAVSLPIEDLYGVSTSVLEAEKWLRTNVLAHYPATNISTILVGHTLLCQKDQQNKQTLILPSVKNIYYSLTRWGLHDEIKVSTSFSSNCLDQDSDMAEQYIKPLLDFFQQVNAPYIVSLTRDLDVKIDTLLNTHLGSMKKLGNYNLNNIFLISENPKQGRPLSRKLSTFDSKYTNFPTLPTPLAPNHSPAFAANSPLPPLIGNISPPPSSLPFAPEMPPVFNPISPFNGPHLPPCIPSHGGGGGPVGAPAPGGVHGNEGLWCVAKPSVPPETLQEALDYACGEGDADCEDISPTGSCYNPDTLVAHASYAFNSYWQKTKSNGGTCEFGGTAMLINSDPSYLHCRFILA
ncbi:glucan endo-1,3-beta-glucosidase 12 [Lycium barbarum]|uniref:glucan endo-1,3-beta-glucosidase 12 n=1 Tax=Lycium barbarum TaxID=112863 RepID=UPI00293EFE5D|nr:glucan endo-1,3-beta-glucosidase 12 [Lycium barbarum]